MRLVIKSGLPFISIIVAYRDQQITVHDILIDTDSASTILAAGIAAKIGIVPEHDDVLRTIRGVGGTEVVFVRQVNYVQIDEAQLKQYPIEIGGMDYGFAINGILGMDFLTQTGAIINLHTSEVTF